MKKLSNKFLTLNFKCPGNINVNYNYNLHLLRIFFLSCLFSNNNNSGEIIMLGFIATPLTYSNFFFCIFFFFVHVYYLFSKDFIAAEFKNSPPKKWWANFNFILETYIQVVLSILIIFNMSYIMDSF